MTSSSNPLKRYLHGGECWALVTGATGGMGEEWSYQLASLGFNIILHGRNETKLASTKASIQSKYSSIQVKTAMADAGACPPNLHQLIDVLNPKSSLRLTVVINNVGVVSQSYPLLEEVTEEELLSQISTNTVFPTMIAQRSLPLLKQNQPSLMVNITSLGAWAATPYLTPYSGAKAFNLHFSRSLYQEMLCEGTLVDVVAMAPGTVISGMNEGPPTTMLPTSEAWVQKALLSLAPGIFSSRPSPVIVPYGPHRWGNRVLAWMGRKMADQTVRNVTLDMRKKKMAAGSSTNKTEKTTTTTSNGNAAPVMQSTGETSGHTSTAGTAIEEDADTKA